MDKELGAANEMVTADLSASFYTLKAAVYNFLGNFFSWLSTHQGLALIFILSVLGVIIWFILRLRKNGKQLEEKVSSKNIEIGKKDALIEEQKNKLEDLQKKLSDQQGVVSEALLRTIKTLTGYDNDQLPIFFKFLTEISGNPLKMADGHANTMPGSRWPEEKRDDSTEEIDAEEKSAPETAGPAEVVEVNKNGMSPIKAKADD